jgi:hypothetical protein
MDPFPVFMCGWACLSMFENFWALFMVCGAVLRAVHWRSALFGHSSKFRKSLLLGGARTMKETRSDDF